MKKPDSEHDMQKTTKYNKPFENFLKSSLETEETTPVAPGIYVVYNLKKGRYYIGSTINLQKRKHQHFDSLRKDYHHNQRLQRDFKKTGEAHFKYFVIKILEKNKKLLLREEQKLLEKLFEKEECYNMIPIAGSCLGRKHSEESKKRMSKSQKGRVPWNKGKKLPNKYRGENHPRFGKTHSEKMKEKLSKERKGSDNPFYGKTHSKEWLEKIKVANSKPVLQLDQDHNLIAKFCSAAEASRKTKAHRSAITHCCQNIRKTAGGFLWKYKFKK